jgi:DNA gyrase/topoisomerase IV subunit A
MNIRLAQQQDGMLLSIETDFDKLIADNFKEICQALVKHLRILMELEKLQRGSNSIKVDELIAVIRRSDGKNAQSSLVSEFNISPDTANYILFTSITELHWILDAKRLRNMIDHYLKDIRKILKLDLKDALFQAISQSENKQ